MILESPALPVAEGDEVVLRCRSNSRSASGSSSSFFRDGVLVGKSAAGNLTIHSISRADGGVYKCQTGAGESPESQLTVMARGSAPSPEPSCCKRESKSSDDGARIWCLCPSRRPELVVCVQQSARQSPASSVFYFLWGRLWCCCWLPCCWSASGGSAKVRLPDLSNILLVKRHP